MHEKIANLFYLNNLHVTVVDCWLSFEVVEVVHLTIHWLRSYHSILLMLALWKVDLIGFKLCGKLILWENLMNASLLHQRPKYELMEGSSLMMQVPSMPLGLSIQQVPLACRIFTHSVKLLTVLSEVTPVIVFIDLEHKIVRSCTKLIQYVFEQMPPPNCCIK